MSLHQILAPKSSIIVKKWLSFLGENFVIFPRFVAKFAENMVIDNCFVQTTFICFSKNELRAIFGHFSWLFISSYFWTLYSISTTCSTPLKYFENYHHFMHSWYFVHTIIYKISRIRKNVVSLQIYVIVMLIKCLDQ